MQKTNHKDKTKSSKNKSSKPKREVQIIDREDQNAKLEEQIAKNKAWNVKSRM